MKFLILGCIVVLATARPRYDDDSDERHDHGSIGIVRDDRYHPNDGKYSFNFETENGIIRSESGSPLDIDGSPSGQQGEFSFNLPNGERFTLKFIANEHGFQPQSPFLPVPPEFPHPIPNFVLDQIEKARLEDLRKDDHDDSDEKGQRRLSYNK